MLQTIYRACTLCEATCGLRFEVEDGRILSVRGDDDDPFSRGYACPKGIAIADVSLDPERLREPMRRKPNGEFEAISWEDAFELAATRLDAIRREHGGDAVGFYYGNPVANNHGALLLLGSLTNALGTKNRFSSGSQDASPRIVTSYFLYGSGMAMPIPDVDRTHYFLCIGANPIISHGSVMTAPDIRRRLRAVRERGGKVVVVDPRRTETAREADEYVSIRPGSDAALLLAMVQVLVSHDRIDREGLASTTSGWEEIERRLAAFTPERVTGFTGVPAETIERLALEFADAESAVAYSRMGVCAAAHSTAATYATDLLNIAAGRLGCEGGPMFTTPAFPLGDLARRAGIEGYDRWRSRVRGLPETVGDLPSTVLAEEIETPGSGQIRAMVTYAGNPVLSAPNGRRLGAAFAQLDFMLSVDVYVNETTRHAHVILPPCPDLADDHIDLLFSQVSVRNVARWSPPVIAREEGRRTDWEILLELTERLGGGALGVPIVDAALRLARPLGLRWTPTGFSDLLLRLGPYGDRFLPWSKGLNMRKLAEAEHGIDLGPMQPGFEHRVYHSDRRIHLAPEPVLRGIDQLERDLDAFTASGNGLVLIGRRELRSTNSWTHNVPALVSGRERCVLLVHPDDAERYGLRDGGMAVLTSRVHSGEVRVAVSDEIRPGVVSLPHGWGHGPSAPWQSVAAERPGVSANDWTDDAAVEGVIGQSILNGVPVRLAPASA